MHPTSDLSEYQWLKIGDRIRDEIERFIYASSEGAGLQMRKASEEMLGDFYAGLLYPRPLESDLVRAGVYAASRELSQQPRKASYKALRRHLGTLPTREVAGQMALLKANIWHFGTSLEMAALEALPIECKNLAYDFKSATTREEKFKILQAMIELLSFEAWIKANPVMAEYDRESRGDHDGEHATPEMSPASVLPHVFKRFPDSPIRPNCYGAATLVAAWCRLAGMHFMHCRLIEDDLSHIWSQFIDISQQVKGYSQLHGLPLAPVEVHHIEANTRTYETLMSDTRMGGLSAGHAFICAEMDPGMWVVLDAWMQKCYVVDSDSCADHSEDSFTSLSPSTASRILRDAADVHPGLTVLGTDNGWARHWGRLRRNVEEGLLMSKHLHDTLQKLGVLHTRNLGELMWVTALALERYEVDEEFFMGKDQPENNPLALPSQMWGLNVGFTRMFLLWQHLLEEYGKIHGIPKERLLEFGDEIIQRMERDASLAQRVVADLITAPFMSWMHEAAQVINKREDPKYHQRYQFVTVEYGNPRTQIALCALTHLMAYDETTSEAIHPTDLLRLTSSQITWYEAVNEVHQRYHMDQPITSWSPVVVKDADGNGVISFPKDTRPTFGELVLTDRHDWADLLESAGVPWLAASELALIRETTRQLMQVTPARQHLQVRRVLERLEREYEQAMQKSQPQPDTEEAQVG